MSAQSLSVSDAHVSYGRVPAVRGVSLTVPRGSTVALVGPNGAGKSSLLRAISGLVRLQVGMVTCSGVDVTNRPSHVIAKIGIAHVPEGRRVISPLSVEENLKVAGAAVRKPIAEGLERVYEMFPRLEERRRQNADSLSGGEQQMLAIGRAMMAQPQYVLFDEPSMGLAPIMIKQVFEVIRSADTYFAGAGVLLAEQSAVLALDVASHVYVLSQGEIVLDGDADSVARNELIDAYLGRTDVTTPQSSEQRAAAGPGSRSSVSLGHGGSARTR